MSGQRGGKCTDQPKNPKPNLLKKRLGPVVMKSSLAMTISRPTARRTKIFDQLKSEDVFCVSGRRCSFSFFLRFYFIFVLFCYSALVSAAIAGLRHQNGTLHEWESTRNTCDRSLSLSIAVETCFGFFSCFECLLFSLSQINMCNNSIHGTPFKFIN